MYRQFGLMIAGFIALVFGWLLPGWLGYALSFLPYLVSGVLVLWSIVAPMHLGLIYVSWVRLGQVLGWMNTRLILGFIFLHSLRLYR